jgi:RNA polymerase sigma-70 factor (ECF subfamily)
MNRWMDDSVGSRPLEEHELIERARGGDVAAYDALVRRYQDIAVRTAHVVVGRAEAEDAAQEAFMKAYRALPRFRAGAPFRPWLLRIVTNEARNRIRSARRREALALRAAVVSGEAAPSPEAAAVEDDERRALLAMVEGLPEADREIIGYRYFLGLSEAETAAALDVPAGTVKSRLSRALTRLRTEMVSTNG